MREAVDQIFHIFIMVTILGFGLMAFLGTSGMFDRKHNGQAKNI